MVRQTLNYAVIVNAVVRRCSANGTLRTRRTIVEVIAVGSRVRALVCIGRPVCDYGPNLFDQVLPVRFWAKGWAGVRMRKQLAVNRWKHLFLWAF